MKNQRKPCVLGSVLAFPLALFYWEIIERLSSHITLFNEVSIGLFSAAAAVGMLFAAICFLIGNDKWSRIIGLILLEAMTIWFLVVYFTGASFQAFMDVATIFGGAKNVVKGFGSAIVTILTKGIPIILLYHVPVILCIVFRKKLHFCIQKHLLISLLLFIGCAVCFAAAYFSDTRTETLKAKCTNEYSYDSAVRQFGVLPALGLDLYHLSIPEQSDEIIFTPEKAEPETEKPAAEYEEEPQSSEQPEDPGEEEQPDSEPVEEPIEYGYNVLDIDFDALIANTNDDTLRSVYEYVSSLQPSRQNAYTGLFEGKNLILITAESFTKELIDPLRTPTLYRLANKGIVFEDFYQPAWGGSTSTGEFSFLTGIIPMTPSAIQKTIGHNLYFTLGNQLQREGYFSRAYHNGDVEYYNRHLTHQNLGYSEYIAKGNGMEKGLSNTWPESDLEMLEYTVSDYIDQQPFSVYYMSISGHCNYLFRDGVNALAVKNKAVTDGMEGSEKVLAYYAANQELEYALSYLVDQLEQAGIEDDTVIAICTDHYPYGLEKSVTWGNDRDYLLELYHCESINNLTRDHNAAIVWSGCLEDLDEPIVIPEPSYSLDLVPTLSNLFGLPYDSRLLIGRDVLSDEPPLVLWMDCSWLTEKGYYNASNGTFTPADGCEIEAGYVNEINAMVSNKMSMSKALLNYDFYGLLFGEDTCK